MIENTEHTAVLALTSDDDGWCTVLRSGLVSIAPRSKPRERDFKVDGLYTALSGAQIYNTPEVPRNEASIYLKKTRKCDTSTEDSK